jgi:stage IV sporulation protein B
VVRGKPGTPGEIKGYFTSEKLGSLIENTELGMFGALTGIPEAMASDERCRAIPIARRGEVTEGKATIYSTLDENGIAEYEIELSEIRRNATAGKCFSVKVTDPRLIEKSGGIVQGMSGSPIIQNGKLVGAVTHVLINDPTTGYGIFIENMLNAADIPMAKAS